MQRAPAPFQRAFRSGLFLFCLFLHSSVPSGHAAENTQNPERDTAWATVWKSLQTARPEKLALEAEQDGPPLRHGDFVLFRYRAPQEIKNVYLAGTFNGWAQNSGGKVTSSRFAMHRHPTGVWSTQAELAPQKYRYQYVIEKNDGTFEWMADPNVSPRDSEGHSVLDVGSLEATKEENPPSEPEPVSAQTRELKPYTSPSPAHEPPLNVEVKKVWVAPDEENTVTVHLENAPDSAQLALQISTPLGALVHETNQPCNDRDVSFVVPALKTSGGYIATVTLTTNGRRLRTGQVVLSVLDNVADDLRYGFYASFSRSGGDYDAKAAMLTRLHLNAVEFYDYFRAHGEYAPRESEYKSEPFGIGINARDIQQKIDAGHQHNVLSLAYVAAYSASESVYRNHPDPMTDENGAPKIFNGEIMTEPEADRQKRPKWFWLMNVSEGSEWRHYILDQFRQALDDKPDDLVSFDGFEVDTYGDSPSTRFYARNSRRSGDFLSDVLHDFVGDVQKLTHEIKPRGLVSFNSVNEFGVERMYDVTDFLFLEIWDYYTDQVGGLVDICYRNRAPRRQRVVLKLYPANMTPKQSSWPESTLARLLGASMTGGGSLMVAGEPSEQGRVMHGLNSLFYPDHQPLRSGNEELLQAYYGLDALLFGYTHGRDVFNADWEVTVPDSITRTYAAPEKQCLVVQILHAGKDWRWTSDVPPPTPLVNQPISFQLPGAVRPSAVYFTSPDVPALQVPVPIDFEVAGGNLRALLPELRVHGTLILQY